MPDVVPLVSSKERLTPREIAQLERDIGRYIDRVAGREDPKLREQVRRDMQKSYMRLGSMKHTDRDVTEEEG